MLRLVITYGGKKVTLLLMTLGDLQHHQMIVGIPLQVEMPGELLTILLVDGVMIIHLHLLVGVAQRLKMVGETINLQMPSWISNQMVVQLNLIL